MTAVHRKRILQCRPPLHPHFIPAIRHPAIGLQQHRRPQVLIAVPPVRGTAGGAAGAEDALVEAVKPLPVLDGLKIFTTHGRRILLQQIRLNAPVLFPEVAQILERKILLKSINIRPLIYRDKIAHNVHVRQRVNLRLPFILRLNLTQARQRILPIDVHGTRPTNALSAGSPECQRRIQFIFDFHQGIQNHGTTSVQINLVLLQPRFLAWVFRVLFKV